MRLTVAVVEQVSWTRHLLNLLGRAWLYLLSHLGTTTLYVIVFLLLIPAVVRARKVVVRHRQVGWAAALRESLEPAWIVGLWVLAWLILYGWAIAATLYADHTSLVAENERLRTEVRALREAERQREANLAAPAFAVSWGSGTPLNGTKFSRSLDIDNAFSIPQMSVKNSGAWTPYMRARLYLSHAINSGSPWQPSPSDDPEFPSQFIWIGNEPLAQGESWPIPSFRGAVNLPAPAVVKARLNLYGGEGRATANFTIVLSGDRK